jgi:hypothetical protein
MLEASRRCKIASDNLLFDAGIEGLNGLGLVVWLRCCAKLAQGRTKLFRFNAV